MSTPLTEDQLVALDDYAAQLKATRDAADALAADLGGDDDRPEIQALMAAYHAIDRALPQIDAIRAA